MSIIINQVIFAPQLGQIITFETVQPHITHIFIDVLFFGGFNSVIDFFSSKILVFGRFLILTAGYSGILVFAALDYVRLSYIFENRNLYHLLPDNVLNLLTKAMKRKELFEFLKPVSMVLALVPAFFLPFGIFCAIALIATIGDGAASLIGESFGKHHFPKKHAPATNQILILRSLKLKSIILINKYCEIFCNVWDAPV